MSIDTSLHGVADLIESLNDDEVGVERVSVETTGETLTTTLTVGFPLELAAAADTVSVGDGTYADGSVAVDVSMTFESSDLPDTEPAEETTASGEAANPESDPSEGTTTETPAYRDPEALREVYDECDSFEAMKDALDVDVTAQTVRRNMMKHGIHKPNSTGADDGSSGRDSQVERVPDDVLAVDDAELPDGVTPETVRDAVVESSSLHGVQLALDLEMKETRALLQDLGVLEHVTGRLADRDADPDPDDVEAQIYDSLRAHADGGSSTD